MNHIGKGVIIAGAAAALILGGQAIARASSHAGGGVKCVGGNACSGKGECGTATHDCAGKNKCKGQGWVMAGSAEECVKMGGKPEGAEKKGDE
jgi:hypothetical protein